MTNYESMVGVGCQDDRDAATKAVHIADIVRQAEEVQLNVQFTGGEQFVPL